MSEIINIDHLITSITQAHSFFVSRAQKQVNFNLTLRNWLIGYYIFHYEQKGRDRAQYGDRVLGNIATTLKRQGVKGLGETNLKLFRQFYTTYPQFGQTLPDQLIKELDLNISQTVPDTFRRSGNQMDALLKNLTFSHFVELMKADYPLKLEFYEVECMKNNWSVRELNRAMNSMLYERTGLSNNRQAVLAESAKSEEVKPEDIIKNPYVLEFLGLPEKTQYNESDLETAIIDHLQKFLLELGRGFCFEARQKRITFGNTHYRVDLVFYHRILKCHVLVDLKVGEFTHADAGQMNVYLNYFKDKEMNEGDNDPVGIILCASKNEDLVKYATTGLAQNVFVSKYLTNLPTEEELRQIIAEEKDKIPLSKAYE